MSEVALAISGSLRNPSFTEKLLDLCIYGMGAEVDVHKFYPHKMNIGPCTGCWCCWDRKTPGECVQKDDFKQILDAYKSADYFPLAAPLYFFDFPATVKNVIDRFFIILKPTQLESPRGGTEHPKRFGRNPKAALISLCGFPEVENFDLLRRHFRIICEHVDWKWSGEILISAAGAANAPKLFDRKYGLVRKAGAELREDTISRETIDAIAAPVMPAEYYRRMATLSFEGGMMSKAKMAAIAMKAMRHMRETANDKAMPAVESKGDCDVN